MNRSARVFTGILAVSLASPGTVFAGREVACESHSMRHEYCSTGRHGDVKLLDHSGFWPCKEGESWGVETEGIWVDRGCHGRFFVDDVKSNSHSSRDKAIAAAVGVGLLALLAANANSKSDKKDETAPSAQGMPNWVVGKFHGYNPRGRYESTMSVGTNGIAESRVQNKVVHGSWAAGNTIQWSDGDRYNITRTDQGLRLTQVGDAANIIDYYRD